MSSQTTEQVLPTGTWGADTGRHTSATRAELAVGHAHEHLDSAGYPGDPTQQEALRDSVQVLLGERENVEVAV
jgi:hypothetical protein